MKVFAAVFPPLPEAAATQTCEINRSRYEARCLILFPADASTLAFPFVAQAARLTRCIDSRRYPAHEVATEFLVCSRPLSALDGPALLAADRAYWGIETGLHLRLDVSAGEDRSRVHHPTAVFNLALMRRAVISVAIHWIQRCSNPRDATTTGFYAVMRAKQVKKAFSLVTKRHSSALRSS